MRYLYFQRGLSRHFVENYSTFQTSSFKFNLYKHGNTYSKKITKHIPSQLDLALHMDFAFKNEGKIKIFRNESVELRDLKKGIDDIDRQNKIQPHVYFSVGTGVLLVLILIVIFAIVD